MKKKLTNITYNKYCSIIDEWFVNKFKGIAAYKKHHPNVKDTTAAVNFSKIKDHPDMQDYISKKQKEVKKAVNITHEDVLRNLQSQLEIDITETIGLSVEEIKKLPIEIRRAVIGQKTRTRTVYDKKTGKKAYTDVTIDLKFFSKETLTEMINRHIGFYEADNEQKADKYNLKSASTPELIERAKAARKLSGDG